MVFAEDRLAIDKKNHKNVFFLFAEETDNEAWQFPDERQPVLATLSTGLSVIKKDQGRNILLTPWESAQLRTVYKVVCAEYARLETLFEAERRRARNTRRLATFPSISCWQPESHHLSANETSMLKGGDSCANKFHYIQLSDATRGAIWVLRGAEMEAEKREGYAKSSYIVSHQGASPSFGRVQYFLQHSFGHSEHYIAVVDWFGNPELDTNSRLWFVPSREAAERSVIQIANLSQPLATAVDDDKLWFLNYSMS